MNMHSQGLLLNSTRSIIGWNIGRLSLTGESKPVKDNYWIHFNNKLRNAIVLPCNFFTALSTSMNPILAENHLPSLSLITPQSPNSNCTYPRVITRNAHMIQFTGGLSQLHVPEELTLAVAELSLFPLVYDFLFIPCVSSISLYMGGGFRWMVVVYGYEWLFWLMDL